MSIPILMYHEVEPGDVATKRYTVSTDAFEAQLRRLRDGQYHTPILNHRFEWPAAANRRSVIVTFDDSHLCHYTTSFPLLQRYSVGATFFVVTSFLDQDSEWMTRAQLRAMRDGGMAIQSHTHTHRFLDTLTEAEVRDELKSSKQVLEDCLGERVTVLSCPGGRYNQRVFDVAAELGYQAVCTSVPGLANLRRGSDRIPMLPRYLMTGNTAPGEFDRMVRAELTYAWRKRASYTAKYLAKRALGNNTYHQLWQLLAKKG